MRKFYCGENTTNFMDSEVYYYRCVLAQNLVAKILVLVVVGRKENYLSELTALFLNISHLPEWI